jgi:hypothetical protein
MISYGTAGGNGEGFWIGVDEDDSEFFLVSFPGGVRHPGFTIATAMPRPSLFKSDLLSTASKSFYGLFVLVHN